MNLTAQAKTALVVDFDKAHEIKGVINGRNSPDAVSYLEVKRDMKEDAYLIIDSPGGSVLSGFKILRAMNEVKATGNKVVCVVRGMAISMAFAILSNCDVKLADKHSVVMFHNVRMFLQFYTLRAVDAKRLYESLTRFDTHLAELIAPELGLDYTKYKKLCDEEILYTTTAFNKEFPKFRLKLYDAIKRKEETNENK